MPKAQSVKKSKEIKNWKNLRKHRNVRATEKQKEKERGGEKHTETSHNGDASNRITRQPTVAGLKQQQQQEGRKSKVKQSRRRGDPQELSARYTRNLNDKFEAKFEFEFEYVLES